MIFEVQENVATLRDLAHAMGDEEASNADAANEKQDIEPANEEDNADAENGKGEADDGGHHDIVWFPDQKPLSPPIRSHPDVSFREIPDSAS